ncbi:MAG: uracil-DNA glycosylase family protein, partial [Polynucleobacter victoriensis]
MLPTFAIGSHLPPDWKKLIAEDLENHRFDLLEKQVNQAYKDLGEQIAPTQENIFRALKETPVNQVRVVILGQDPYQTPGLAQGLAFSIPKEIKPGWKAFPSSLRNISKALALDGYQALLHGDLSGWAKQGVLLLNATLTVQLNLAASHAQFGWQNLTDAL